MSQDTLYNDGVLNARDDFNCATTEFAQGSPHKCGSSVSSRQATLVLFCPDITGNHLFSARLYPWWV